MILKFFIFFLIINKLKKIIGDKKYFLSVQWISSYDIKYIFIWFFPYISFYKKDKIWFYLWDNFMETIIGIIH